MNPINSYSALRAVNRLIVMMRSQAYKGVVPEPKAMGMLMDEAEYLIVLMLNYDNWKADEFVTKFRGYLERIEERFPEYRTLVQVFDEDEEKHPTKIFASDGN